MVTAPVNKARLRAAGFPFPGQTEFFTERLGAEETVMMLAAGKGTVLDLEIQGNDEDAALEALTELIQNRFDEAE